MEQALSLQSKYCAIILLVLKRCQLFATEADTMIDIVYDFDEDKLEIFNLAGTFTKFPCENVKPLFSMSLYLYFSIIHIGNFRKKGLFITSVTRSMGLIISN